MKIDNQIRLEDINPEYSAFVEKFKPKKTTDDCYTPENIYDVIRDYVCDRYGIDKAKVMRPFWPGGDYLREEYAPDSVVIDNPPFSIVTEICRNYVAAGVRFWLFAPYLTNFGGNVEGVTHIITGNAITYANGAVVDTAFLTNMEPDILAISLPELGDIIDAEEKKNRKKAAKEQPKYVYPDNVLTAAMLGYMANHHVHYEVKRNQTYHIRVLDSQRESGKAIFGGGYLLSEKAAAEKAAAEKAAAEKAAAEKAAATRWSFSDREKDIIKHLGGTE